RMRHIQSTKQADRTFHLAIADATNNPRFREFLEMLGRAAIPRALLQTTNTPATPRDYLLQIQQEHRHITEAIADHDEALARKRMRIHLKGSQQRYRALFKRSTA